MSQSSGKDDSVKAKIERTAKGVKCKGLKSGSSQPSTVSKKAPRKTKTRYPARKTYMSKVQNKEPTNVPLCEDVTDEEEIDAEDSPVKSPPDVVPDVETSGSKEISAKENSGNDYTSHEDSEPTQAPTPVQDISDDVSDDEPLVKSIPDSIATRMKRKRRVSTPEVTPTPPKRSKSSPVTYKSRQASVKNKGKQKAVKTPSEKKKRKIPVDVKESESDAETDVQEIRPYESVQKWKFVSKRRMSKEREVGSDALECKDVIALIEKAGLMKTFRMLEALGRSVIEFADEEVSMDDVAKELTAGYVKKLLSTRNLTVKYAILNRIGALQEEERQSGEQSAAPTAAQDESQEEEEGSAESAEASGAASSSED
ncbi:uncharacterized protein LOC130734445 [Lotus japonicus]|uniref:uncharacterized protein LOC130734445 n=1 Tax=Lotus japonicus TaxID=34305 RepID=UPI00258F5772|nr:uncharacterized protein LOC130734445 [Lotus japonicus]